ncbi:aminoimidazole riboside kinase [Bacillus tianshenii]|nr:aminoimidazole riboside kinase [Bacillus tianshenii]
MEKQPKGIITLGEALIDFIPLDVENINYQKSPGGAPANVAVGAARLGSKTTFVGKVGDDVLGEFLHDTLKKYGVQTEEMSFSKEVRTGVVFVTLQEDGERSFEFYINPGADQFLRSDELNTQLFRENRILHIGSISMIREPVKGATDYAVTLAKENGMIVSFDPNIRLSLWTNEQEARETILDMLPRADIVKVSEEEVAFLTGEEELEAGIEKLAAYRIPLLVVTCGKDGSRIVFGKDKAHVESLNVEAIDTTGAGDAFMSAFLYKLNEMEHHLSEFTLSDVVSIARFASISGGLAVSKKGAMTALPTMQEVEEILRKGAN